jgi:hypothetical protein
MSAETTKFNFEAIKKDIELKVAMVVFAIEY